MFTDGKSSALPTENSQHGAGGEFKEKDVKSTLTDTVVPESE